MNGDIAGGPRPPLQQIGIEKISLYAGRMYVDAVELALARGRNAEQIRSKVMVDRRSVMAPFEDAVTFAVNAAKRLLGPEDARDVELLIVGSESGVDFGKPISTWVHRFCGLPENCRNFELKHACYGGTGALKMALSWLASNKDPRKKALVISSDFTRPGPRKLGYDFVGGGCAVAMLVGNRPEVLEIDIDRVGYWTNEIADTFRPTASEEIGDNQTSLYSYLDALDGAYDNYEKNVGSVDFDNFFCRHIYHTPFPGMAFRAHRSMLGRLGITERSNVDQNFAAKVAPGLCFAKQIGSAYGASTFVCLSGLLHCSADLKAKDRISFFSYGSGCQGEFYDGCIGPGAARQVRSLDIPGHLEQRRALTLEQYEAVESARELQADDADWQPDIAMPDGIYDNLYKNHGLLVLRRLENYRRVYDWS